MFVLIMYILNGLYMFVFTSKFLLFKTQKPIQALIFLICSEIIEFYIYFHTENIIYSVFLDFILFLIMFKDSFLRKITTFILFCFTTVFSKFIITIFLEIPHIIRHNPNTNSLEFLLIIMIAQIIEFIELFIISKFYKNRDTFRLTYITLIPILLLTSTVYWDNTYWFSLSQKPTLLIFVFIMIIVILICFFIQYILIKNYEMKRKLEMQIERNKFNEAQLSILKNKYNTNFNFLHELLHNLSLLNNSIELNNIEDIKINMKKIEEMTYNAFNRFYSNNPAMALVLNNFQSYFSEKNIKTSFNIDDQLLNNFPLSEQIDIYSKWLFFSIQNISNNELLIFYGKKSIGQELIELQFKTNNVDIQISFNKVIESIHLNKPISSNSRYEENIFKCIYIIHTQ